MSTLYFETDQGDGFREPGFSKERRLEPQTTIGLLTDHTAFPLMLEAFESNKGETLTMIPTIRSFMAAHHLPDVTVVADAGMVSAANQKAIEDAGLSFIIGARIPQGPYVITAWRQAHPGQELPDGHVFTPPWPAGPTPEHREAPALSKGARCQGRSSIQGEHRGPAAAPALPPATTLRR